MALKQPAFTKAEIQRMEKPGLSTGLFHV